MSLSTNTTYRVFVEKLGGTDPANFVGDVGEVFLDPSVPELKLSDGTTAGGVTIGSGGGESYWVSTAAGIHTLSNVGIGTTNPTTKLQVGGTVTATAFVGDGSGLTNLPSGGGGGTSDFVRTDAGIHTLGNVGVGTTNPTTALQISGVLGFDVYDKSDSPSGTNPGLKVGSNILLGDSTTGKSLVPYGSNDFEGMNNVFIGVGAGSSATSTYANHFVGKYSGRYTTTGNSNIFFGVFSGEYNTTGGGNQFFGASSGITNTTGEFNHFFGTDAGYYNTIGSENNFFGSVAGFYNTTGGYNSFFGCASGVYNQTGSYNLFLGCYTGFSTSASNKVIIGRGAGWALDEVFDSPNTDNDTQLAIGIRTSSDPANYWLVGDENFNIGIGTTNPTAKLDVIGDVRIGINTSQGVILTDANGVAWRLVVNTDGTLTTASV